MDLKLILVIGYAVVTLMNCIILILNVIKKAQVKKGEETTVVDAGLEVANYLIREAIPKAIELAEQEQGISGATKKMIATSQIIQDLAIKGVDYKDYAQLINEVIEEDISFSKSVNVQSKYNR